MVASTDRASQNIAQPSTQPQASPPETLRTKDAMAIAASMKNDPFRYYAERDAGIVSAAKPPVNPKDPFSYYYGKDYKAEQEAAAQRAKEQTQQRAQELQAKYAAPATPVRPPRADAEMSMSLGSVAVANVPSRSRPAPQLDPEPDAPTASIDTEDEEHPLQRWGRQEREARKAASQQLQQGMATLKQEEEDTLEKGEHRVWLMTGVATLLVLLAGGAYLFAPKFLERQAESSSIADSTTNSAADSTANGAADEAAEPGERRGDRAADTTLSPASDSDTDPDENSLLAGSTLETPRSRSDKADSDDVRSRNGRSDQAVARDELIAPLGLNGGNFSGWWRGEPVNAAGGSRLSDDEDSRDFEADAFEDEDDAGGRLFGDDEDDGGDQQTISNPTGDEVDSSDFSNEFDTDSVPPPGGGRLFGDDDSDDSYTDEGSVPAPDGGWLFGDDEVDDNSDGTEGSVLPPGSGLLFGGSADSGAVPVSMTYETVQLSIRGIANAIPRGIDSPVEDQQRVGRYRVTDTYLPCQNSDTSDCRSVHPVYGYHNVPHFGVDLAMPNGAPIFAVGKRGSTVTVACSTSAAGGVTAEMSSTSMPEYEFRALHLSDCIEGTFDAGTIVAAVGATGGATGPHLHWEALYNNERVDPPRWSIEYAIKGDIIRSDDAKFTY